MALKLIKTPEDFCSQFLITYINKNGNKAITFTKCYYSDTLVFYSKKLFKFSFSKSIYVSPAIWTYQRIAVFVSLRIVHFMKAELIQTGDFLYSISNPISTKYFMNR